MDLGRVEWIKTRPQWSRLRRVEGGETSTGLYVVGTVSEYGTNLDSVAGWVPTWSSPLHGQKNTVVLDTVSIPGLDVMNREAVAHIIEAERLYVTSWNRTRGKGFGPGSSGGEADAFDIQSVHHVPTGGDHECLHFRHRIFEKASVWI